MNLDVVDIFADVVEIYVDGVNHLSVPGDHHEPLQGKYGEAHNWLNPYKIISNMLHSIVAGVFGHWSGANWTM